MTDRDALLRCYLPAYLVADVRRELMTADPLLPLIHGFSEMAIVAYLEFRRDTDELGIDPSRIEAALTTFWRARAEHAPTREDLARQPIHRASGAEH